MGIILKKMETDCAPIPSFSASCSCVNPALSRSARIFFPSSISDPPEYFSFTGSLYPRHASLTITQTASPPACQANQKISAGWSGLIWPGANADGSSSVYPLQYNCCPRRASASGKAIPENAGLLSMRRGFYSGQRSP